MAIASVSAAVSVRYIKYKWTTQHKAIGIRVNNNGWSASLDFFMVVYIATYYIVDRNTEEVNIITFVAMHQSKIQQNQHNI